MYLLAFDSPCRVSRPPHVTLELLERRGLPVSRHLPQDVFHHLVDGLLLVRVHRLVKHVHGTRPVLPEVLLQLT